jgi:hypothetical protein
LAISVTQLKYRFNAKAGVTKALATISDNAVMIAMTSRNTDIFALIELWYKLMIYKKCD